MKKITLMFLMLGFSSFLSAQCLTATNGQYPDTTYTAATCDGSTLNEITTLAFADEYSLVNVTAGETYQFSSSNAGDVITIADEAGTTTLAYGENAYVLWLSDIDGVVRFYTHKDNACSGDGFVFRTRGIVCGTPPSCFPAGNITVSNLTTNTATVTWIASISAPAGGYDYIFTEDSTAPDASTSPTGSVSDATFSVDFSSLVESTHYYFWVRSNCGGGDLSTWRGKDFTTLAPPPVNDDISGALELVLDLGTECGPNQVIGVTNDASTESSEVAPSCAYNPTPGNGDVWYYIVAPAPTINISISNVVGTNGSPLYTVSNALYSGTSGNLTEVGVCDNAAVKTFTGLTVGETYYLRMWDYSNDGVGTWDLCGYYLDCEMPVAEYTVVSDCANGEQFTIDVNITEMGTATSLTIADDQGSAPQVANGTGTFTFGPFPNATPVIFTIANDQNSVCTITSPEQVQVACPPANDSCDTALAVTSFPYTNSQDASGATNNDGFINTCAANGMNDGVWYTFVGDGGDITINLNPTAWDPQLGIYTGTCGALTCVGTVDNGFSAGDPETYTITGSLVGTTYYVNAGYYSGFTNDAEGVMDIEITSTALGIDNAAFGSFAAFPNPVKNILKLSNNQEISNVAVLNMLGQQIMVKSINANIGEVDMSNLASGTYFVKVTAENQFKTIKVVKQ
ncbi:T9SS type A sorting domain-containing protein [Flavobacterium sp.]|uniref:T9SS type A sorting domain-containing protein n=1 Tax=Flavobacterium sp. TaxID=239 RepID=UPI00260D473C|nr:T9SS type A sorting domain-containing protein [Flavobacterium sp.]